MHLERAPGRVLGIAILIATLPACREPRSGPPEPAPTPEMGRPAADARAESGPGPSLVEDAPDATVPEQTASDAAPVPAAPDNSPDTAPATEPVTPAACEVGATRCAPGGKQVEVCTVAGAWVTQKQCPAVCEGGACTGRCTPGDKQCGPAFTPETCDERGEWIRAAQPCANVCQGGDCGGECRPGLRRCGDPPNSLTPYVCDEMGRWRAETSCMNLCSNGSCGGSCMPGTRSCSGNTPRTCSATGNWVSGNACQAPQYGSARCQDGVCGISCPNGMCGANTCCQCNGHGDCPGRACVSGACTGECAPTTRSCAGTTPQTCNDMGRWVSGNACQVPQHGSARCDGGTCGISCPNGTCGAGACCECNENSDCTSGTRRACMSGRCVESVIRNVSYIVEGTPDGQNICMNANPPGGCARRRLNIQKCDGLSGRCTIKIAWTEAFGGDGELGSDPCPFIVKNVLDLQYTCSHNGVTKDADPGDFRPPMDGGCVARLLGTAVLSCP